MLLIGLLVFFATACRASPEDEIMAVLKESVVAWNRGDVVAFMSTYAQSESLRFASGGTVARGWKAALERYQKVYPDKAAMGTLAFSELEVTMLAPDAAIVFGHWQLTREKDKPSGLFTLTWKKTDQGWKIIQDHTSSAAP